MLAVGLAILGGLLFGAYPVSLRYAFARSQDAEQGSLITALVAILPTAIFVVARSQYHGAIWPFLLAGLLAPGIASIAYLSAVREVGASRTAVVVGIAPLVAVGIALAALGEPVRAPLVIGALLVVVGGAALAAEGGRPEHLKAIGLLFAVVAATVFAARDAMIRGLSTDTRVGPQLAALVSIVSGSALIALYLVVRRRRAAFSGFRANVVPFTLPGLIWGGSYVAVFEAYYRGRVSVVSPLIATESLFGVLLATLFLRRTELIGRHVLLGAALVVGGGALIGAFR